MRLDEAYRELNIVQDFIPHGNSNRPGTTLRASSITIHNTDNADAGANAAAHARYQKGADAQNRQVSWHFTVDDHSIYQSLPVNEIGWHTARKNGNGSSIGIEICMNEGLDEEAAYRRAALLVAVVARRERIELASQLFQHNNWSGKNCPVVLRSKPTGWEDFRAQVMSAFTALSDPESVELAPMGDDNHHGEIAALEMPDVALTQVVDLSDPTVAAPDGDIGIAWGRSVPPAFTAKVRAIAANLGCDPSHLMAAMAFETGETFSPSIRNHRSGATGLIQFLPSTAATLNTSVELLAKMSAVEQIDVVERYLRPYRGRMRTLSDVYMTILWPKAVGQPDASVIFRKGDGRYEQNSGLDVNRDGAITKGEAASKVQRELDIGLSDEHRGSS